MSFENPKILYALPLLLIPIIIHLVQWKRYKKEAFTNVDFLKELEIKSRKSRKLKEWLVLLLRTLALLFLIFAFAGPDFNSKKIEEKNLKTLQALYFDNSLSLDLKEENSTRFFHQKMKLIDFLDDEKTYGFFTNTGSFKNIQGKKLKNYLYKNLRLSPVSTKHTANLQKAVFLMEPDTTSMLDLLYFSDNQKVFQEKISASLLKKFHKIYIRDLSFQNIKNISLDSLIYTGNENGKIKYRLWISTNDSTSIAPILIKNGNRILWTKEVSFKDSLKKSISFELPQLSGITGEIQTKDKGFDFDNHLYFTYSKPGKIKILWIGEEIPPFIKKIYTPGEFSLIHKKPNQVNYAELNDFDLIIIYKIPPGEIPAHNLKEFLNHYGNVAWIPQTDASYSPAKLKNALEKMGIKDYSSMEPDSTQTYLNRINFSSPFFKNVFLKPTKNFDYPSINKHLKIQKNSNWLYSLSNNEAFVQLYNKKGNFFLFATDLSDENFIQNPYLTVPLFYQMAKWQQGYTKPYFVVGEENTWNIPAKNIKKDEVVKLKKGEKEFIPFQIKNDKKIRISTGKIPDEAGIYKLVAGNKDLGFAAFNYNRKENSLQSIKWPESEKTGKLDEYLEKKPFDSKDTSHKNRKIWAILALLMLILEMLVLKFWK